MAKRTGNTNSTLNSAKSAKNDEFYTQLKDIENELCHYESQLKGKVIFCNCDDPAESNFFLYFIMKFKKLKLKGIIATHYVPEGKSYKIEVWNDDMAKRIEETIKHGYDFNSEINRNALQSLKVITPLKENGDFRSPECIELLQKSDMVITNPPFSLFREYVAQLVEHGKKFVIVGHQNAISYKEIFKLIKESKIWLGFGFRGGAAHFINVHYENYATAGDRIEGMIRVSGVVWFTNLDITKRHEYLILYKNYTPEEYPTYDNYDAINVDKTKNIPMDYDGVMGVPITFLDKFNPEQFDILGITDRQNSSGMRIKKYADNNLNKGSVIKVGNEYKAMYVRLLIRRKTAEPQS